MTGWAKLGKFATSQAELGVFPHVFFIFSVRTYGTREENMAVVRVSTDTRSPQTCVLTAQCFTNQPLEFSSSHLSSILQMMAGGEHDSLLRLGWWTPRAGGERERDVGIGESLTGDRRLDLVSSDPLFSPPQLDCQWHERG